MVGVAGNTDRATVTAAELKFAASVGVNVADKTCVGPTFSTVPA